MIEKGPCALCGHHHRIMASVWYSATADSPSARIWLCHQDDHSCYVGFRPEKHRHLFTHILMDSDE
jgi:hypothetical protein